LPQYARDPELVRMLADEARVQASLTHPNLVRVFEFGRAGKDAYIALELVDGTTLRELLRDGALPRPLAVHVVAEVVRALVVVHAAGVVHRDVTPENILLSRTGGVHLGDFGIARSSAASGRTRTGVIKGKLAYLAPEQVAARPPDARTDLYAIGLVLYEAVAGEPYLRGDTEPELLRAAESPERRATGDTAIDELLAALLAPAPADRPAETAAVLASLEALGPDGAGLAERADEIARRDTGDELQPSRRGTVRVVARRPRRRPLLALIGVAVAATVAVAIVWIALVSRGDDTRATGPLSGVSGLSDASVSDASGPVSGVSDAAGPASGVSSMADASSLLVSDASDVTDALVPVSDVTDASHRVSVVTDAPGPVSDASGPSLDAPTRVAGPPDARVREAPDAMQAPDAGSVVPQVDAVAFAARVARLGSDLAARGILEADLPAGAAAALGRARAAKPDEAGEAAVIEAQRALAAIAIDDAFVRAKLARLDAAIKRADRKVDRAALDRLAASALEDLLDRRYDACNRRLNQLAGLLAQ
jgi:serine/threonine-protein kinase